MNKVRINQGRLFNKYARLGIVFLVLSGMALSFHYLPELPAIFVGIVLSMFIPFFWHSFNILEIDPKQKSISKYILIFNKRFQAQTIPFSRIDKIVIESVKAEEISKNQNTHGSTTSGINFHASLRTSDGGVHFLVSHKNSKTLEKNLAPIAIKLQTSIALSI